MNSSFYLEIFGNDDIQPVTMAPIPKETPELATDNDLFRYSASTGAAAAMCAQLQGDAFVAEVSGLDVTEVRKIATTTAQNSFQERTTPQPPQSTAKTAARKTALAGVICKLRNNPAFRSIRYSDGWEKLLNSATSFVDACCAEVQ